MCKKGKGPLRRAPCQANSLMHQIISSADRFIDHSISSYDYAVDQAAN